MSISPIGSGRTPRLISLLRIVHQATNAQLVEWLEHSGYHDLQPAHAAVLQPLWEMPEGTRVTLLARASRVTKQSMSALVDHLEMTGYVERVEDPEDARAVRVRLTAKGRAHVRAARQYSREVEARWAKRIGTARVAALRATLEQMRRELLLPER
jgi:DNA-binding MarR family transcriptional regulator